MAAGRSQADQHIAFGHIAVVQHAALFHDAGGIAGQVVFIFSIQAGHFGSFAADQGTAGLLAAFYHAFDDFGGALGYIFCP